MVSFKFEFKKHAYQLVSFISPASIVLGRRSYFSKEHFVKSYERLEADLNLLNWKDVIPPEPDILKLGEFVLVKSTVGEDVGGGTKIKRGVVQEMARRGKVLYKVFLYDFGEIVEIGRENIALMNLELKQRLPPRTVIVNLIGLVPAKLVIQPGNETKVESAIMMMCSRWPARSLKKVKEWFEDASEQKFYIACCRDNNECSCVGDILRKVNSASGNKDDDSLISWMLDSSLALFDDDLYLAQAGLSSIPEPPSTVNNSMKPKSSETAACQVNVNAFQEPASESGEVLTDKPKSCAGSTTSESSSSSLTPGAEHYRRASADLFYDLPGYVLVRGAKPRKPLERIQQLKMPAKIVDVLSKMGVKDLSDVQRTVAPNFMRGSDIIVIAPDGGDQYGRNARLLSYSLPMITLVHESYENTTFMEADQCSPEAIIVVNSFSVGEAFKNFLHSILSFSQDVPIRVEFLSRDISLEEYSKQPEKYAKSILPPGISILIVTLSNFSDILKTVVGTRLLEQLRFLVFEELECYVKAKTELLVSTIDTLRHNSVTHPDVPAFQMTFSGSVWFPAMEELYCFLVKWRSPVVVIGAVNQVIRYANIAWNVHHVKVAENEMELNAKKKKLLELLSREFINGHRIVIACRSSTVANEIYGFIRNEIGFSAVIASNQSTHAHLTSAMNRWARGDENIAIISDEMIHRFEVTDATCLIQYDCPLKERRSRNTSAGRYSFVWSNIRDIDEELNPHKVGGGDPSDLRCPRNLVTHILMTEEDPKYLYAVYNFSKSLDTNVKFPRKLREFAEMIAGSGETNRSLCAGIKLYGFCDKAHETLCSDLHEFTKSEISAEPVVPVDGQIEVRIVQCENPSLFKVQLLRHFVYVDGEKKCSKSYLDELCERNHAMNEYYCPLLNDPEKSAAYLDDDETASNRSRLETSKIAAKCQKKEELWCAVYDPSSRSYMRARVLTTVKHDVMGLPEAVRVQIIDTWTYLNPLVESLYELPSKFKKWRPLIVNLVLGNLKPIRGETEYRPFHIKKAKDLTKGKVFEAKIWLSIGDTIWVNPMVEYVVDSATNKLVKGQSVRMEFMQRRIAEINGDHLGILMTKVANHGDLYRGISVVKAELLRANNKRERCRDEFEAAKKEFHQIGDSIRWAFVERSSTDRTNPVTILTIYGRTPWVFFGVHEKFQDQLKDLEKDLHNYVEDYKSDKSGHKWTTCTEILADFLQPEMIVAAKEREEKSWMRAKIISKTEKNCGGIAKPVFKVFFVDYGDEGVDMEVEEIFPIPHRFVTKLPFQAIAFKLNYIEPKDMSGNWEDAAINKFLDTILPDSKIGEVDIIAFDDAEPEEDSESVNIPCRYYSCVGFINEVELNSLLVQSNLASWKPGGDVVVSTAQKKLLEHYNKSVNAVLARDEEEDPDDEGAGYQLSADVDVHIDDDFTNQMLSSFGLVPSRNGVIQPALNLNSIEYGAESRNRFENVAAANARVLPSNSNSTSLMNRNRSQDFGSSIRETTSVSRGNEQPTSSTTPDYLYPTVLWGQTENNLVLTVQLPNVKEYDLRVEEDKRAIFFRTKDMPKNYGFVLYCFGKVLPDFKVHLTGQYLRVTFRKMVGGVKWTRLLHEEGVKYHWLKADLNIMEDDHDDEEEEEGSKYKPDCFGNKEGGRCTVEEYDSDAIYDSDSPPDEQWEKRETDDESD